MRCIQGPGGSRNVPHPPLSFAPSGSSFPSGQSNRGGCSEEDHPDPPRSRMIGSQNALSRYCLVFASDVKERKIGRSGRLFDNSGGKRQQGRAMWLHRGPGRAECSSSSSLVCAVWILVRFWPKHHRRMFGGGSSGSSSHWNDRLVKPAVFATVLFLQRK